MKRKVYHSDYCPKIENNREIILNIADFNVVGTLKTQYKITSFQCPDAINCQFHKEHFKGLCPVADTLNLQPE